MLIHACLSPSSCIHLVNFVLNKYRGISAAPLLPVLFSTFLCWSFNVLVYPLSGCSSTPAHRTCSVKLVSTFMETNWATVHELRRPPRLLWWFFEAVDSRTSSKLTRNHPPKHGLETPGMQLEDGSDETRPKNPPEWKHLTTNTQSLVWNMVVEISHCVGVSLQRVLEGF